MIQIKTAAISGGPTFFHVHKIPVQYQPGCIVAKSTCVVKRNDLEITIFTGRGDTNDTRMDASTILNQNIASGLSKKTGGKGSSSDGYLV